MVPSKNLIPPVVPKEPIAVDVETPAKVAPTPEVIEVNAVPLTMARS